MTIQELIDLLNKVEDKSKEVGVGSDGPLASYDDIIGVDIDDEGVIIKIA